MQSNAAPALSNHGFEVVFAELEKRATSELVVAIEGGSECHARVFQQRGPRARGPFVVVKASGDSKQVEAALFGSSDTPSAFGRAKDGVVFIESLAALGDSGQARLYKLLQGLLATRSSGSPLRWPPMVFGVDGELSALVMRGRVRADLAEVLRPSVVTVPSNGAPREVAPEIRVAPEAPSSAPSAAAEVVASDWSPALDADGQVQRYEVYEAQIFRFALKQSGGCVSRAAEELGVGRATMYRKMRAYDIEVPPVSERSVSRPKRAPKP